jgi:hypothetical protein
VDHSPLAIWWPVALVVVIEHRQCKCGYEFITPGPSIMLRKQLSKGYIPTKTSRLDKLNGSAVSHFLPHEHEHIITKIDQCQHCFPIREPFNQAEMFPQDEIPSPTFIAAQQRIVDEEAEEIKTAKKEKRSVLTAIALSEY